MLLLNNNLECAVVQAGIRTNNARVVEVMRLLVQRVSILDVISLFVLFIIIWVAIMLKKMENEREVVDFSHSNFFFSGDFVVLEIIITVFLMIVNTRVLILLILIVLSVRFIAQNSKLMGKISKTMRNLNFISNCYKE